MLQKSSSLRSGTFSVNLPTEKLRQAQKDGKLPLDLANRFFSSSLDLLCTFNYDGCFQLVNQSLSGALGYPPGELVSQHFVAFVHPDDRESAFLLVHQLAQGLPDTQFENRYRRRDGGYCWFDWKAVAIPELGLICASARDVTAQKRAVDALQREKLQLERRIRDLEAAMEGLEHLRQLIPICTYCRRIRDDEEAWHRIEEYFRTHSELRFSHAVCPDCYQCKVVPELANIQPH